MKSNFDCVVMLTMSDWKTEPRSNRYHYAIRFAKQVPTFFVQFDGKTGRIEVENTEIENLYIVHAPYALCERDVNVPLDTSAMPDLELVINKLGGKRRLIWSYNPYCTYIAEQWDKHFHVYHATEIYMIREPKVTHVNSDADYMRFGSFIRKTLSMCDLVVSVASGAEETIRSFVDYKGEILRLHNGCDHDFWIRPEVYLRKTDGEAQSRESRKRTQNPKAKSRTASLKKKINKKPGKTIFYQGGVNHRLDFDLLNYLAETLPDWKLIFCGQKWLAKCGPEAEQFFAHPNVEYIGMLKPEQIRKKASEAAVGIIPFVESYTLRNSLPLKAYEYVACGLPVVTTPIKDLIDAPELFHMAFNKEQFVDNIKKAAKTRFDRDSLATRLRAARVNSYDGNFRKLELYMEETLKEKRSNRKLNILVLYCEKSTANRGLRVGLEAIRDHSEHNVYFAPGSTWGQSPPFVYASQQHMTDSVLEEYGPGQRSVWDFNIFDAVIVHYSVRLTFEFVFSDFIARQLSAFEGPKLLYIQDEYEKTEMARKWMDLFQFDIIYTCVPDPYIENIYPAERYPNTQFKNVLTGYVTKDLKEHTILPLEDRKTAIAYRGRQLSHRYGKLGYEKREIGIRVKEFAEEFGVPVDIEWEDQHRIYTGWLDFLGSARATLATESGSNMFDFDGSLGVKALQWKDVEFEEAYDEYFGEYDNYIKMAQISPKVFEAISVGTVLVCFEGEYSGVIKPNIHFIPLKKDYSNIEDVFKKVMDDEYVRKMTDRAYKDIILSGDYSIESNVAALDKDIESLVSFEESYEIITTPIAIKKGMEIMPLYRSTVASFLINNSPFYLSGMRKQFLESFEGMDIVSATTSSRPTPMTLLYNEALEFSPYNSMGNIIDAGLREERLIARIRNSKNQSVTIDNQTENTPRPTMSAAPVAAAPKPKPVASALDLLIADNPEFSPAILELNGLLRLERFSALGKRFSEIFTNGKGSIAEKRVFANHITQYMALGPITTDPNLLTILEGLTQYYTDTQKDRDVNRLYDLEFVLRKNSLAEIHEPYMRAVIDTIIAKEPKAFDPRLYMSIYYYYQLYHADENMNDVRIKYHNKDMNIHNRMLDFGLSQEGEAKKFDEERNIDNSYMARLFQQLVKEPASKEFSAIKTGSDGNESSFNLDSKDDADPSKP